MLKKITLRLFPAILVVLLMVWPILGCGGDDNDSSDKASDAITPIKLVPLKSNLLGYIDLGRIVKDPDVARFYDSIPKGDSPIPQTFKELMDATGVDLDHAILFADISDLLQTGESAANMENLGYFGLIVKGTFEENSLIQKIESETEEKMDTVSYKGYSIHTDPSAQGGLVFLGKDGLVIGSMQAINDTIEVKEGTQSAIKGKTLETYNSFGNVLVKLVVAVPKGEIEKGLQNMESPLPIDLSMLGDIETVTLTVDKKDQTLPLALQLCFTSQDSAENVKGLIGFAKGMLGSGSADMSEAQQALFSLLKDMEVTLNGSCVNISLALPLSVLEDLTGNLIPSLSH